MVRIYTKERQDNSSTTHLENMLPKRYETSAISFYQQAFSFLDQRLNYPEVIQWRTVIEKTDIIKHFLAELNQNTLFDQRTIEMLTGISKRTTETLAYTYRHQGQAWAINIIGSMVAGRFASVAEVNNIFQSVVDNKITFWIFTGNEEYDDELMDRLLDIELDILEGISVGYRLAFRYIHSNLFEDKKGVAGDGSVEIFKR